MTQSPRHFVDLWKIEAADLRAILDDAKSRKAARRGWPQGRPDGDAPARERTLAMIFQKNSTRTRFSFDAAMRQLGGDVIISTANDMQLGRGETIEDTAKVLSRMVDAIMLRANSHEDVERLAYASTVPVINGLSDRGHPCQIIADLMTFEEHRGPVAGRTFAWTGDGNNVLHSMLEASARFSFSLNVATPEGSEPQQSYVDWAKANGGRIRLTHSAEEAVTGADCVVTDTWVSMNQEHRARGHNVFGPYQVNAALMAKASPDALFMHCLPAHRGEEVTDEVIDGPHSVVFDEAENRLHAQKAVLAWCLGA